MTVYMPPISRKKKVQNIYNPNSFRVFGSLVEDKEKHALPQLSTGQEANHGVGLQLPSMTIPPPQDHRIKRKWAGDCFFLRQDVRLLNEPVCMVKTKEFDSHQNDWWPSRVPNEQMEPPKYTYDTTFRRDYKQGCAEGQVGLTRHGCNPNTQAAWGIAPVNFLKTPSGKQRFLKEGISYEHQFNSRLDASYPARGKRHGSFVWEGINPVKMQQYLKTYGFLHDKGEGPESQSHISNKQESPPKLAGAQECKNNAPTLVPVST